MVSIDLVSPSAPEAEAGRNARRRPLFRMRGWGSPPGVGCPHTRLAALRPWEIDVDRLGEHLKQVVARGGGKACICNNSELKRAIRIYDWLRFHDDV